MNCSANGYEPVILEHGSIMTRVGFARDITPRFSIPTNKTVIYNSNYSTKKEDFLPQTTKPLRLVEEGIIVNWDGITQYWDYLFNNLLNVASKKSPVLLIVPPLNPRSNQEKIAEIMFEHLEVPALSLKSGPELILQQSGKDTGLVMHFDLNSIDFVPILEKQLMPHLVKHFSIGSEINSSLQIPLRLAEDLYDAIMQIEFILHGGIEFRKLCVQNIVIAGELSKTSDFTLSLQNALIQQDLEKGSAHELDFHITHPPDPKNAAWIAGAKLAIQPDFSHNMVSLQDYQKKGPSAILYRPQ